MDIVEKEWQDRIANNLPPHHSITENDTGFIFNKPIAKDVGTNAFLNNDYDLMEKSWSTTKDIRSVVTLKELPSPKKYDLPEVVTIIESPKKHIDRYSDSKLTPEKFYKIKRWSEKMEWMGTISPNLKSLDPYDNAPHVNNNITYLFCDGLYFKKFGAKLALSIKNNVHIHLMDASPDIILGAEKLIHEHKLTAGLSVEQPDANPEYYHSIRFIRWYQYMQQDLMNSPFKNKYNPTAKLLMWPREVEIGHYEDDLIDSPYSRQAHEQNYSIMLDVDAIANHHPSNIDARSVGMRLRPARLEPWNVCNASVCVGRQNAYWKGVADYIYYFYKKNKLIWQIDQVALWAVWQKEKRKLKGTFPPAIIRPLNENDVNYDYDDKGIIWCNSGKNKWQEHDPSRQKYRDKLNTIKTNIKEIAADDLEREAKLNLKQLNLKEAKRLYLRLLRKCFENLPKKQPYIQTTEKQLRKVEKILYLPVEISARELASREWLAKQMKGWKVVIGNRWQMQNWQDLPSGVVLWKSANTQDVNVFTDAINAGHLVCLMDEELFPMLPKPELYKASLDKRCLDYADVIFAHSKEQKNLYKQLTNTKVEVTGNPRSLLSNKVVAGDRIIVCTMAGTINNFGRTFYEMIAGTVRLLGGVSEETFDFLAEQIAHEIKGYGQTRKTIEEIKDLKPLIRCHPSEDISFWEDIGELDDRTPFVQRLNDAKCIVYVSGCGTGLEATLAGVPTVRLGDGGFGASAIIGSGASVDLKEKIFHAYPQKIPEFAEVTLPDAIKKLQAKYSFNCPFNVKHAYSQIPFEPTEFHKNKFPTDPEGELIGWRTVLCLP
tara:strand:+ start:3698 stop:6178 length:2481 start_codon:yes stop_codon:yes gene_type:complete